MILVAANVLFFSSVPVQANDWQNPTGVCMDCGNDSPSPVNNEPRQRRETKWEVSPEQAADLNARAKAFDEQVQAVWARKDFREYLRLCLERQKVADSPTLRRWISSAKAVITWTDAKTAAELRHAIRMEPKAFTDENLRHVESVEAAEKAERERPAREARARKAAEANARVREKEALAAAKKINARIRAFADTLDISSTGSGKAIVEHLATPIPGGMDTRTADVTVLEFGDPNALETRSEKARQMFDKDGSPIASEAVAVAPDVVGSDADPRMIEAEAQLTQLTGERATIDAEIEKLIRERSAAKDPGMTKALTVKIDQKIEIKGQKDVEIVKKKEENQKLHRTISTEISAKTKKIQ